MPLGAHSDAALFKPKNALADESFMKPYYSESGIEIYHGDCREVLPALPKVDALICDPPYGVELGEVNNGQARAKQQSPYTMFQDTADYLKSVVVPVVITVLAGAERAALFCGNRNLWLYPPAEEVGCWYVPAATSRGRWGFNCSNVILYYGKSPRAGIGDTANSFSMTVASDGVAHPCPKPLAVMKWLVNKASKSSDIVLDPFAGSGTTLQAAKDLGRKAIGIEIEEKYCEIAANRLRQEVLSFEAVA